MDPPLEPVGNDLGAAPLLRLSSSVDEDLVAKTLVLGRDFRKIGNLSGLGPFAGTEDVFGTAGL